MQTNLSININNIKYIAPLKAFEVEFDDDVNLNNWKSWRKKRRLMQSETSKEMEICVIQIFTSFLKPRTFTHDSPPRVSSTNMSHFVTCCWRKWNERKMGLAAQWKMFYHLELIIVSLTISPYTETREKLRFIKKTFFLLLNLFFT